MTLKRDVSNCGKGERGHILCQVGGGTWGESNTRECKNKTHGSDTPTGISILGGGGIRTRKGHEDVREEEKAERIGEERGDI